MALDPSISLQAGKNTQNFDLSGLMQKGMDIQRARQDLDIGAQKMRMTENELAVQPRRLEADTSAAEAAASSARTLAEQQAAEAATKRAISALGKKHSTTDPKTGRIVVDYQGMADDGSSMGLDAGTVLAFSQKAAEAAQSRIKTIEDATAFAQKQMDNANNLIRNADPVTAAQIAASTVKTVTPLLDRYSGEGSTANFASKYFGLPTGEDGKPLPAPLGPDGTPDLNTFGSMIKKNADIVAASTITPLQERELSTRGLGTQQMGADSTDAKNMRAFLKTRGIDVPASMDIPAMMRDPTIAKDLEVSQYGKTAGIDLSKYIQEQNVIPASAKVDATTGSITKENNALILDTLAAAAAKLGPDFKFTPAQVLAGKAAAFSSDPNYREYETRIKQAQAAGIPLSEFAPSGVAQFARKEAALLREQGRKQSAPTRATTFTEANNAAPAPAPAPAKPAVKTGGTPGKLDYWVEYDGKKLYYIGDKYGRGVDNLKNYKAK